MKNDIYDYLIFKLNSEFADYEFDLISIPPYRFIENGIALEPYEYFGEINEILEQRTKHIFLYFNADILMRVKVEFKGNKIDEIKKLLENNFYEIPANMKLKLYFDVITLQTILEYQQIV